MVFSVIGYAVGFLVLCIGLLLLRFVLVPGDDKDTSPSVQITGSVLCGIYGAIFFPWCSILNGTEFLGGTFRILFSGFFMVVGLASGVFAQSRIDKHFKAYKEEEFDEY